ncbi:MAG: hypothetical protein ACOCXJ_04920 [Planctomycetota bacterium]
MLTLSDEHWNQLLPELRQQCPSLTDRDLEECDRRSDILVAKIQNRQWISKQEAMRLLWALLERQGLLPV